MAGLSLSPSSYFFSIKQMRRRKRKREGLGKEFAQVDNFPRLTKMCLVRENRKGHD